MRPDSNRRQDVLRDHQRVRSKLVPPLMQRLPIQDVSYVRDLLPELCWVGLVHDALGYRRGIEIVAEMARDAHELHRSDAFVNFALCRSYAHLTRPERDALIGRLEARGVLNLVRIAIEPLVGLYERSPLGFIGVEGNPEPRSALVNRLRRCVTGLMDKRTVSAGAAQAMVLYIGGLTGGIYFKEGMDTPDLDSMIDTPESEAGLRAAAFVRSFVLHAIAGRENTVDGADWPAAFWNESLHLDDCSFAGEANDE